MNARYSKWFVTRRGIASLFVFFALSLVNGLTAASRGYYDQDTSAAMRELRDSVDALRHEVANHETEIRQNDQRIDNQEATLTSLRQQVLDTNQANKELVKGCSTTVDSKLSTLESTSKSLVADVTQLRTHANDTAAIIAQYKQKIAELENLISLQSQNIDNLQAALKSLMEAMGTGSKGIASADGSSKIYKVKNGDSLEKIARANNTTVKAIKELNGLTSDRINIGQALQMP